MLRLPPVLGDGGWAGFAVTFATEAVFDPRRHRWGRPSARGPIGRGDQDGKIFVKLPVEDLADSREQVYSLVLKAIAAGGKGELMHMAQR